MLEKNHNFGIVNWWTRTSINRECFPYRTRYVWIHRIWRKVEFL